MKPFKIYPLATIEVLLFTSCSKDYDNEDNSSDNNAQIVLTLDGFCKSISYSTTALLDLNGDEVPETNITTETNCFTNETLVFNPDSTGVNKSTSYADIAATLRIETTNSYTDSSECIDLMKKTNFIWTKNNNTITVLEEGFRTYFLTLNNNELTVIFEDAFSIEDIDSGTSVVVDEDFTLAFVKQ